MIGPLIFVAILGFYGVLCVLQWRNGTAMKRHAEQVRENTARIKAHTARMERENERLRARLGAS